jgi:hypothetical protein
MRLIVFAKAPVPGVVKTRLVSQLGAAGAARLHTRLVERALETALAAALGPVELCCAPDRAHPFFAACAGRWGISLTEQGEGDLGERMHRALAAGLPALLVGADCPALTPAYLDAAAAALGAGCDLAFGPAEDGGYVLVGASRLRLDAFARIRWGGPDVMAEQRARLGALGLSWRELETLWDVDRPADLDRLRRGIADGGALLTGLVPEEEDRETRS